MGGDSCAKFLLDSTRENDGSRNDRTLRGFKDKSYLLGGVSNYFVQFGLYLFACERLQHCPNC